MRRLAFILVLSIVGCGGSELSFTPLQAAPHQLYARIGAQVELFLAARPTRPFVEIGMLQSEGSSDDQATLLAEMRGIAGQHGCEGLIILGANEAVNAAPGALAAPRATDAYRGSCIVYTAPAGAAAAPVAAATPTPTALAPVAPSPTPPPVPVITTTAPVATTQITTASKPAAASCQPNAAVTCYGIGGCSGTQRCAPDGSRYSPCACAQAATATK